MVALAPEGGPLVVCEVRGRRAGALPGPALSLDRRKRLRLLRAALLLAAARRAPDVRVDVLLLTWGRHSCRLRHLLDVGDQLAGGGSIG